MKKGNTLVLILAMVSVAVTVAAAVSGIMLYLDRKKKAEVGREHYLDCSIQ